MNGDQMEALVANPTPHKLQISNWTWFRYCRRIRRAAREGAAIEARSGTILLLTALIPLCDAASARGPSPPSPVQRIRRQYLSIVKHPSLLPCPARDGFFCACAHLVANLATSSCEHCGTGRSTVGLAPDK